MRRSLKPICYIYRNNRHKRDNICKHFFVIIMNVFLFCFFFFIITKHGLIQVGLSFDRSGVLKQLFRGKYTNTDVCFEIKNCSFFLFVIFFLKIVIISITNFWEQQYSYVVVLLAAYLKYCTLELFIVYIPNIGQDCNKHIKSVLVFNFLQEKMDFYNICLQNGKKFEGGRVYVL